MTNHVHLLLTPLDDAAVGAMLQDVGRRYVRVMNMVHGRTGSLWGGRYKASLIDSERYFLTCQRYIELNPVRAGLADTPDDYLWSSYGHYARGRSSSLLTEHSIYETLGQDATSRQAAYRSLFDIPLQAALIKRIRETLNSDSALASEQFIAHAESQLGRSVRVPKRGRPSKSVTGKLL